MTIDNLEIEIKSSSQQASNGINRLAASLAILKQVAKGGAGLKSISSNLDKFNDVINKINIPTSKIYSIATALNKLSSTKKITGLSSVSKQITDLGTALDEVKFTNYNIDGMADAINKLSETGKVKGLSNTAKQVTELNTALLNTQDPTEKVDKIVGALNLLPSVQKAEGMSSVIKQLQKLPEIASQLEKADMDKFAKSIEKVTAAIRPLANEMEKVSRGFSAFPLKIQRIIEQNEKGAKSFTKLGKGFNIAAGILIGKRIGNAIGGWIQKSNEYVENLNLFTVSMGEYAEEAKNYAETVGELMGIDPSEWLRAQGIFNTLATGFGVASDKAAIMSKNLTQLSYDISSLYNISISDSMTKLQSAFSGELEPVRRLGYDLSQTKLQAIATSKGITKNIANMNQAEKSMIRYYALMTQVTEAQGDMARTLNAPANQLRIFNAQLEQTKRSLGNIFIPALNAVLPYLIAFLKLIRTIANEIANFFGFELPEIDYSNVNNLGSGIDDNFKDANAEAKKLKNTVTGIDELNIISPDSNNGNDNGIGGVGFDMDLPEYNFLEGLTDSKANEIFEGLKDNLEKIKGLVIGIGIGLLLWKLSDGFKLDLDDLKTKIKNISAFLLITIGLALLLAGAFDAWVNGLDWENLTLMIAGIGLLVGGLALKFGLVGVQIGLIIGGIVLLAVGIKDAFENGINWKNLTSILLGITAIVTMLGLKFGLVAVEIAIIVGAIALLVIGIRDLALNGANPQNLTAIYVALAAITVVLTIAFGWVGLIIGLVVALLATVFLFLDTVEGAVYVVGAFFKNVGIWIANLGLAIWEGIKNVGKWFGNLGLAIWEAIKNVGKWFANLGLGIWEALKASASNIKTAFVMAWLNIKKAFLSFVEMVLDKVKFIADKINKLLGVFGIEIDVSGLESQIQKIKDAKSEVETELSEKEFKDIGESFAKGFATYAYGSVEEAFNTFDYGSIGEAFNTFEMFEEGWAEEAWDAGNEVGANFRDGILDMLKDSIGLDTEVDVSAGKEKDGILGGLGLEDLGTKLTSGLGLEDLGTKLTSGLGLEDLGTKLTSGLDNSSMNTNLDSINSLQNDSLSKLTNTDTNITDLTKLTTGEGLTNQKDQLSSLQDVGKNITTGDNDIVSAIKNGVNTLSSKLNEVKRACENIKINITKVYGGEEYATGGYPTTGQMFIANEAGPELVGRIGTKTAVANQEQITEGIARAVYSAMINANQSNGQQDINVYISGKQVNSAVEKAKRDKGTSIMTGGLIYG